MKLLIITQKVDINDDLLGFFHDWLGEFAKLNEKLNVICLQKGDYELPGNVSVFSLGKEKRSRTEKPGVFGYAADRLVYAYNFLSLIWEKRQEYDVVFVHMNTEYVILAGWLWKLLHKRVGLWYVHKKVNWKLSIAEKFVEFIFTASPESLKLKTKKKMIVGHGIDIKKFSSADQASIDPDGKFRIIYVGRISQIKNQGLLVDALDILVNQKGIRDISAKLIGGPSNLDDEKYLLELKKKIDVLGLTRYIEFIGKVPNREVPGFYSEADLNINLCPTGGLDKAVLEALASGKPALVLNKTFSFLFGEYKDILIIERDDAEELAQKIKILKNDLELRVNISSKLKEKVARDFSIQKVVGEICQKLNNS